MPQTQPVRRDGSTLCLECGLCCHGVLHDRADLRPDEIEAALALGLPVEPARDNPAFSLPCPKICGTACTIYAQRLSTCSGYRCGLLDAYQAETVSEAQAFSYVHEAKRLLALLAGSLPAGQLLRDARAEWRSGALLRKAQAAQGEERRKLGRSQLYLTMLGRLLDNHFLADREPRMLAEPGHAAPSAPPPDAAV